MTTPHIQMILTAILSASVSFMAVACFKMKRANDAYIKHLKSMRQMLDDEIKSHSRFLHYTEFVARSLGYEDPKEPPVQ